MHLFAIDLSHRDAELVADRCWQAGGAGIWEVDASTLRVGVEDRDRTAFLDELADLDPVDVTEVEAVELAGRMVEVPFAGQVLELWVPATVFGDATHPTTATCLQLLDGLLHPGVALLDVGCGSGVLSVAAAACGARVTAIDIDHEAVTATNDNAARNGVTVSSSVESLSALGRDFDVVVCNMTLGSMRALVDDLVARVRPGGVLVVSGLLEEQWPEVRGRVGGEVEGVEVVDTWVTGCVRL